MTFTGMYMAKGMAYKTIKLTKTSKSNAMHNQFLHALQYAVLSPSGHNTQPWKLMVSDKSIEVFINKNKLLPEVDPRNREALLSLSAFVETFGQALAALGLYCDTETLVGDELSFFEPLFRIHLNGQGKQENNETLNLIQARYTDRTGFDSKELDTEPIQKLVELDKENLAYFPKNSKTGQWIANSQKEAFIQQSYNPRKQAELASWLRFNKSDKESKADGMFPEMLALSGMAKMFWYTFYNEQTALKKSFIEQGIKNAISQVENTPGFIVLTSKGKAHEDICEAGKLYQKVLLKCTGLGLKNHTISQALEEEPMKNSINKELGLDKPVQFIIRVGRNHTKRYGPHIRRDIETIVV
jgi:hypothetical protein